MIIVSEVSQTETDIRQYHLYVESRKSDIYELILKAEIDSQMQKTNLWLPKGKMEGGDWD